MTYRCAPRAVSRASTTPRATRCAAGNSFPPSAAPTPYPPGCSFPFHSASKADPMETQQALGFASFLAQTDTLSKAILAALLLMSMATWYLIVTKAIRLWIERRKSTTFLESFWNAASIPSVEKYIGETHPEEPFFFFAAHATTASRHHQRHGANK